MLGFRQFFHIIDSGLIYVNIVQQPNYIIHFFQLGIDFKRPPLMFLNTYQLDPKPSFHLANVKSMIEEMLDEHFDGHKYNVQVVPCGFRNLFGALDGVV